MTETTLRGARPTTRSTQLRLARRPTGLPTAGDWEVTHSDVTGPEPGHFTVRIHQISMDPAMRGWMNAGASYLPPVGIGEVMRAVCLGEVIASAHDGFAVGDLVVGEFGVQTVAVSDGTGVHVVRAELGIPVGVHLGALGMTGMTAYFGLLEVGAFNPGQTVLISGAAGAVGSVVGQIVTLMGGRAIGIAGGAEKCRRLVEDLGFAAAIDYRSEDVRAAVRNLAPSGVDIYFDNVGGEILDAALANLAMHARVVICGAISAYNAETSVPGPRNYRALLVRRARMEGFVVLDYTDRFPEAIDRISRWIADGELTTIEDVVRAPIERFPDVLLRLFEGRNIGKQILELEPEL